MATMTEPGTDNRIDDLRSEMHRGFDQVGGRFDRVAADIREVRLAIGSFQRLMVGFFATTLGSIIAGVVVLLLSHS
jgi:hypothetical protein